VWTGAASQRPSEISRQEFIIGADISGVQAAEARGVQYSDKGGDNMATRRWVDAAMAQGLQFDILGESCYTRWQGPPSGWKANFDDLVVRYPNLSFVIAEVASETKDSLEIMRSLPNRKGLGTFIREPTSNGNGQALFDNTGAVIPEKMAAYDN
jgi:arabinogalactan endo-1,4-beta-galactosidase